MRDTFYTITHRGIYIHACHNRQTGREEFKVNSPINGNTWHGRTLRAAKLACTRIAAAIGSGLPVNYPHHMGPRP